jgi:lipopolysaccharide/colanic/teichoic acid biosynthesis glycosyltransferase
MERPIQHSWSRQIVLLTDIDPGEEFYFLCKRLIDTVVSLIALIVLMPLMLLVGALIVLESPGPVIFSQKRVGARRRRRHGRTEWEIVTFTFYKFRSMYHNSDPTIHRQFMEAFIRDDQEKMLQIQENTSAPAANGSKPKVLKLLNDPRITRIGKIIRKTSLDELPQLWNVLKGDMTLVGPRPPIPYEVEEYDGWQRERLEAIPGLTCLWQVEGRSAVGFDDQVRLDVEYIEKQSLWLDLKILFQTVPAVLAGKGAR